MPPARRSLRPCLAACALATLVPLLLPSGARASLAHGVGEYFAFELNASTMSAATLACQFVSGTRDPVADPFVELTMQVALAGPRTPLDLTLQYQSVNGAEVIAQPLEIDNDTQAILKGGLPVSSFFDIFGPLPPAVGAQAILECQTTRTVILVLDAVLALINAQPAVYQTDTGTTVPVDTDGNSTEPDVTQQQADQALTGSGFEYGDPNANKLEQVGPPADSYDCHGFTFTKGDRWINDYECDGTGNTKGFQTVQKILDENGYTTVADSSAMAGDIVVYRRDYDACVDGPGTNKITHTGKVVLVKTDGTIIVESKWGRLGRYKHKKDRVPASYGTGTVYRTGRAGQGGNKHTLAQNVPQQPVSVDATSWSRIKASYR
jgi:hypothetical protein